MRSQPLPLPFSVVLLAAGLGVAGCSTSRESFPQRTATEQLLLSSAADQAVQRLTLDITPGAKVFVDATNFEAIDGRYAIGAIRERLMALGGRLVPDRAAADMVVEPRAGALSMDEEKTLFGIPQFGVPVPLAGSAVEIPEISLFKKAERRGVAKLAITGYDARTGAFAGSSGVQYGIVRETRWVVLLFFSWSQSDAQPEPGKGLLERIPLPSLSDY